MTLQGSQVPKRPACPAAPPGDAGWSCPQGRWWRVGGGVGGGEGTHQVWVQCSTAWSALGPTCLAQLRGVSGDERAEPTPTGLVCQPLARSHWGPGGSQQKTGGLCYLLLPGPSPGAQTFPSAPKALGRAISPAQAGARSLTVQQGIRAAGWLPPPGWSPGVSTELCRPLREEMGWAVGWGGVPAQQRAQLTPRTLAAPSTGSSGRGPCRSGAGGVSRGVSKQCPEGPWTSEAGCPVRAGRHCRTGAPRGCGEGRPSRTRLSRACSRPLQPPAATSRTSCSSRLGRQADLGPAVWLRSEEQAGVLPNTPRQPRLPVGRFV